MIAASPLLIRQGSRAPSLLQLISAKSRKGMSGGVVTADTYLVAGAYRWSPRCTAHGGPKRRWPNQVIQQLEPMHQSVDKAQLLYYWRRNDKRIKVIPTHSTI